jgi:putative (di)nucleoside polyphosphate hydrolase
VNPTLEEIDKIRKNGFRPQVVGCIILKPSEENSAETESLQNKILFVYKQKYELWQLPQGGIDNGESIEMAITREMAEELGKDFTSSFNIEIIIGEDKLIFPERIQDSRELQTDAGKNIFMLGKKYFFVSATTSDAELNIIDTEFDDYQWLTYKEALDLTKKIYQKGKRQTTLKVLAALHNKDLL